MANNNFGASFDIDVSALKAGLAQANKLIRESESEFRAAAAGMDDWTKSEEGLTARQTTLNKQMDIQKQKINNLVAEKDKLVAAMKEEGKTADEIAAATDSLNKMITNESKQLDKLKKEYDKINTSLDKFGDSQEEVVSAADALRKTVSKQEKELADLNEELLNVSLTQGKGSKAAKNLQKQINSLNDELQENKKKLGEVDEATEEMSEGFTVAKGAVAGFIANGLSALTSAIGNALGSLMGLSAETREYREDMAKLETAFTTAGISADDAAKIYQGFFGILGEEDRSVEAANHLSQMALGMEDLNKWTTIAAGVSATFGDSLPIEGLTEAANETAKVGSLTGVLADALNWAGVNEEEFQARLDACNSEAERAQLITNELNGIYGESAAKYLEMNKGIIEAREAQARLTDATAEMGERMEPVSTAISEGFAKILEKALELTKNVDFSGLAQTVSDGFDYFIETVIPALVDGFQWIIDNKDVIIAGITAIAAGFIAFKTFTAISSLVSTFTTLFSVIKGGTGIMAALNAVMGLNPVGLLVAGIAGLVAGFIYLWNNCEGFREFWIGLWENIKTSFFTVVEWISEKLSELGTWFSDTFTAIKETVFSIWNSIVLFFTETIPAFINSVIEWFKKLPYNIGLLVGEILRFFYDMGVKLLEFATKTVPDFINKVIQWFSTLPGKIWNWLSQTISKVSTWASETKTKMTKAATDAINAVIEWFKKLPGEIWTWLSDTIEKIKEWGADALEAGRDAASDIVDTVIGFFEDLPGEIFDIGADIVEGLWDGIKSMGSWLSNKVSDFVDGVKDGFTGKGGFDTHSPSKWAKGIGNYVMEGLGLGMSDGLKGVLKNASIATDDIKARISGVNGAMGGNNITNNNQKNVSITQYITNTAPTSRLQLWKNKNETVAAVRLATT